MNKEEKKDLLEKTILEHQRMLYRIAFSIIKDEQLALDAVQETIVKAYSQIHQLRQPEYIKTWLVRILINNCNSLYRENRRSVPFDELPETVPAAPPPSDLEFFEMLRSLPPDSRLIFQLYYGERFTTREIAGMLKMNESTVKSRLSRGKKQLREGLRFQGLA